ncbi:MAG: zinc ribbon domain-containing protein [Candidatus Desulfatibia sp.]|uniref:FmdB family zinc ribbon protein n=1 Tax=Candidatus Desulfatibia sp. TaxID=3101189 RepID=UPI002F2F741A
MPIYEYACKKCGHGFEVLRLSSKDFNNIECPKCESKKVAKAMSTFAASVSGSSPSPACETGSCPAPSPMPGCSSGMCGLN